MKPKVFVSHPYADDPAGNKLKVDAICKELVKEGYIPISPLHLFSFYEEDADRDEIMQVCYRLIGISDIVFIYGTSAGCKAEFNYAQEIGKPWRVMI